MGFLDFLFGSSNSKQAYTKMCNDLDEIQNTMDDLGNDINNCIKENIDYLICVVEIDLIIGENVTFFMPIYLTLFSEIVKNQGSINEAQNTFLHELISKHPFNYYPNNQNGNYTSVFSYADAFNYDNSIKGDLYAVGFPSLDSYAWNNVFSDINEYNTIDVLTNSIKNNTYLFYNLYKFRFQEECPISDDYISLIKAIYNSYKNINTI